MVATFTTPAVLALALMALAITGHAATVKDDPQSQHPSSQSYSPPETSHTSRTDPSSSGLLPSHTKDASSDAPGPTPKPAVIEGSCPLYKYTSSDGIFYGVYCDAAITGTELVDIGARQAVLVSGDSCAKKCNSNNTCVAFNYNDGAECAYFSEISETVKTKGTYAYVKYIHKSNSKHSSPLFPPPHLSLPSAPALLPPSVSSTGGPTRPMASTLAPGSSRSRITTRNGGPPTLVAIRMSGPGVAPLASTCVDQPSRNLGRYHGQAQDQHLEDFYHVCCLGEGAWLEPLS